MPSGVYVRSKFCPHGHLKEGSNLIITPSGSKVCKICYNISVKKYRHNKGISILYVSSSRENKIKGGREYVYNWNDIRKSIYKRDKWICQECNRNCGGKIGIACHHVDYNTLNNDCENLITICPSCHAKTNHKREDWIKYYQNKIRRIYHVDI